MAIISIQYNDGNKKNLGYKYVELDYNNLKSKKKFDSGDFVKDWYDCNKFIIMKLQNKEIAFSNSSSVDHFFMDGAKYDSAYLLTNNKAVLSYDSAKHGQGIEFFVKEGTTPTWEELKEMCEGKPEDRQVKLKVKKQIKVK